jgi:hypothetical protein
MEHWLNCHNIPYDVIQSVGTTVTVTDSHGNPETLPDSGGPSCQWQVHHVMEYCYQRGVPHMECSKYVMGSRYVDNCMPLSYYTEDNGKSLWSYVKGVFTTHAAKACEDEAGGAAITGAIVMAPGGLKGAVLGFVGGAVGGCVGGLLHFYYH